MDIPYVNWQNDISCNINSINHFARLQDLQTPNVSLFFVANILYQVGCTNNVPDMHNSETDLQIGHEIIISSIICIV